MTEIKQLMDKAIDGDVGLTELLRRAMIIAKEHDDQNFVSWIKAELNEYDGNESIPEYRRLYGSVIIRTSDGIGWYDCHVDDIELQRDASTMVMDESIDELNDIVVSAQMAARDFVRIGYHASLNENLLKTLDNADRVAFTCNISKIFNIFEKVKNRLLEQLSDLNKHVENNPSEKLRGDIFPPDLVTRLPRDIRMLAGDFNFNCSHNRPEPCFLILRKMLPLSIIRRFQAHNKENDIKDNGEFLSTMGLLGKAKHLTESRRYSALISEKNLLDATQHSATFRPEIDDVIRIGNHIRLFLGDIFPENDE